MAARRAEAPDACDVRVGEPGADTRPRRPELGLGVAEIVVGAAVGVLFRFLPEADSHPCLAPF